MGNPEAVRLDHFSDVLCVWAYVSQIRLDQLRRRFAERLEVRLHFIPVFGSTDRRIGEGWSERGGLPAYADHVEEVLGRFSHVPPGGGAWRRAVPATSAVAHLLLKAVQLAQDAGDLGATAGPPPVERAAWAIREAFFARGRDVARQAELRELAAGLGLPEGPLKDRIASGEAMAALCRDTELRDEMRVEGSPTYILNEGRQKLYGNVGYRILEANVEEVLSHPAGQASWC